MAAGAPTPELSAWITLGAAVVAPVSALAGVGLAALLESRRERRKWRHEQAVRFHDERLSAYTEYIGAVTTLFAAASVWANSGVMGSLTSAPSFAATLGPYNRAFGRVKLLAGPGIDRHLSDIHGCVARIVEVDKIPMLGGIEAARLICDESIEYRAALERAAQVELGIIDA